MPSATSSSKAPPKRTSIVLNKDFEEYLPPGAAEKVAQQQAQALAGGNSKFGLQKMGLHERLSQHIEKTIKSGGLYGESAQVARESPLNNGLLTAPFGFYNTYVSMSVKDRSMLAESKVVKYY